MKALIPKTNLSSLRREMDRLIDRFWDGDAFELEGPAEWAPCVDVSESNDALVVKAEIPGIDPKDIDVAVRNGVLMIRGERKHEDEEKNERFYRMERSYGTFARMVRMPVPVDEGKIEATFKNGILTVTLPKTVEAKGTKVPVKAA